MDRNSAGFPLFYLFAWPEPRASLFDRCSGTRVVSIQSAMLVALGLLVAGFVVLMVLPFYRRRAERLLLDRVKRSLPMSEAEIRADKDRLRAEYAIRIHQLETKVDETKHLGARQTIELNRRDGRINTLESEITTLRTSVEEHENARRVLEQTITDRLPKLEQRLVEARRLLVERDVEIERLTALSGETKSSLDEARQINKQQREELMRLNASLTTRAARSRDTGGADFDAEVALRAELEALRARAREQAQTIAGLQGQIVRNEAAGAKSTSAGGSAEAMVRAAEARYEKEIAKLRSSLTEAEEALGAARSTVDVESVAIKGLEKDRATLKLRVEELEGEVSRQRAALAAYEAGQSSDTAIKESKVAMKARLGALESTVQSHLVTIQGLRAELAAANERMARQATHFRDELRRLGAGTTPVSAEPRSPAPVSARRPSLADRMSAPRPVAVAPTASDPEAGRRVTGFLKALSGGVTEGEAPPASSGQSAPSPAAAGNGNGAHAPGEAADAPANGTPRESAPARRSGLLERISDASKTSAKS
ncbi:MAG: hypothetical protein AB7E80_02940 [Hyphomicrobiaceae bacterium]